MMLDWIMLSVDTLCMENTLTTKFKFNKFGMKADPRGAHVSLSLNGRDLLGEVIGVVYDDVCGCFRLAVRHFNGEMWPIQPTALAVDVLVRQ
jgi:hypothetical protein